MTFLEIYFRQEWKDKFSDRYFFPSLIRIIRLVESYFSFLSFANS
ncbi:hypothetical protein LEP1GSC192_3692 [Leptospira sp. B5-022]|nr:hypothetical protein LEP1GSC192_3692 [Leptospira sp. B5-022]